MVDFLDRALEGEVFLLRENCFGKRTIHRTGAIDLRVIKEAVAAVAIVFPAGVVEDRVKTNAFDGNARLDRREHFLADVIEPRYAGVIFSAGFGDEYRTAVAFPNLH